MQVRGNQVELFGGVAGKRVFDFRVDLPAGFKVLAQTVFHHTAQRTHRLGIQKGKNVRRLQQFIPGVLFVDFNIPNQTVTEEVVPETAGVNIP